MHLSGVRPSVCLSICPNQPPHSAAVGLLLWARRAGDIDLSWRAAGECGQCHVVGVRSS